MTYETVEASVRGGEPVELYKFVVGTSKFLYTSTDSVIEFNSESYIPITISRNAINQDDEINRSGIDVVVPRDEGVANLFRASAPAEIVAVTIFRLHPNEDVFAAVWAGRVLSCEWEGVKASLACESVFSSQKRTGLRRNFQGSCPHVLYGSACQVNKLAHRVAGPVSLISSGSLTVPAAGGFSDGYFDGGFVQFFTVEGLADTRFISEHVGSVVSIPYAFQGIAVGSLVDLYPGCNHTTEECNTKYSNILNHGGFPYTPLNTPFGGASVY